VELIAEMRSLRRRIEKLEERAPRLYFEITDRIFEGRTVGDLEFFAANAYWPPETIPGPPIPKRPPRRPLTSKDLMRERSIESGSEEEAEFFLENGYWPRIH
jgi:hypothetical protein